MALIVAFKGLFSTTAGSCFQGKAVKTVRYLTRIKQTLLELKEID